MRASSCDKVGNFAPENAGDYLTGDDTRRTYTSVQTQSAERGTVTKTMCVTRCNKSLADRLDWS